MDASARPDRPGPDLPRFLGRTAWLWPVLATLAVTLVQADRAQLWRDELATWSAASRPLGDLFRMAGNIDGVSAPYYLLMHGWIRLFGDSVLALRLPTILAMAGAAGLITVLGERLFSTRTGLIAGLLFAVVPSTSRYGQEARSYAFATFFAVLATLLLVGVVRRPSWSRWAGYALAVLGLGLAHLVAVILLAGHAAAVLLAWRATGDRRLPLRWLVAVVPVGLALTPLALLGRSQQGEQLNWVGKPSLTALPELPSAITQAAPVGGLLVGLAAVALVSRGRRGVALGLCALLPVALLFVGGLVTPLWVPRYLVFTVPFVCLLAADVLATIRLPWALAIVAVTCLLGAPAQADLRRTHEWPRSAPIDYRGAARIIAAHQQPGDGIVYSPRTGWKFLDTATAYHLGADRPRDVLATRDQLDRADLWATECDQPAQCLAPVDRVWLLVVGEKADPLRGLPEPKANALRAGFSTSQVWTVPGLTVALLTRPGA
ncbi:glycosyltransferase family 39 protein [Micromonospora sp. NPDC003197]